MPAAQVSLIQMRHMNWSFWWAREIICLFIQRRWRDLYVHGELFVWFNAYNFHTEFSRIHEISSRPVFVLRASWKVTLTDLKEEKHKMWSEIFLPLFLHGMKYIKKNPIAKPSTLYELFLHDQLFCLPDVTAKVSAVRRNQCLIQIPGFIQIQIQVQNPSLSQSSFFGTRVWNIFHSSVVPGPEDLNEKSLYSNS